MMQWKMLHPRATMEHLGYIPGFLSEDDPRPAKEQLHANYAHGGGWRPMSNFKLMNLNALQYPSDPVLLPIASTKLRNETICIYECAIVAIVQPDGSFEAARMD